MKSDGTAFSNVTASGSLQHLVWRRGAGGMHAAGRSAGIHRRA